MMYLTLFLICFCTLTCAESQYLTWSGAHNRCRMHNKYLKYTHNVDYWLPEFAITVYLRRIGCYFENHLPIPTTVSTNQDCFLFCERETHAYLGLKNINSTTLSCWCLSIVRDLPYKQKVCHSKSVSVYQETDRWSYMYDRHQHQYYRPLHFECDDRNNECVNILLKYIKAYKTCKFINGHRETENGYCFNVLKMYSCDEILQEKNMTTIATKTTLPAGYRSTTCDLLLDVQSEKMLKPFKKTSISTKMFSVTASFQTTLSETAVYTGVKQTATTKNSILTSLETTTKTNDLNMLPLTLGVVLGTLIAVSLSILIIWFLRRKLPRKNNMQTVEYINSNYVVDSNQHNQCSDSIKQASPPCAYSQLDDIPAYFVLEPDSRQDLCTQPSKHIQHSRKPEPTDYGNNSEVISKCNERINACTSDESPDYYSHLESVHKNKSYDTLSSVERPVIKGRQYKHFGKHQNYDHTDTKGNSCNIQSDQDLSNYDRVKNIKQHTKPDNDIYDHIGADNKEFTANDMTYCSGSSVHGAYSEYNTLSSLKDEEENDNYFDTMGHNVYSN